MVGLVALRLPHPDSAIDPATSIGTDKIAIFDVFMVLFLLVGWLTVQGTAQLLPGAYSRAPVGNDRPALNVQLGAGKTKVIEAFIAAFEDVVRELNTRHRLANILTWYLRVIWAETARNTQARERSPAYNYK
jgi:hypothetical protein